MFGLVLPILFLISFCLFQIFYLQTFIKMFGLVLPLPFLILSRLFQIPY